MVTCTWDFNDKGLGSVFLYVENLFMTTILLNPSEQLFINIKPK